MEESPIVSISFTKSKSYIVSTLFSSIISWSIVVAFTDLEISEFAVDVIPVSAKFFNPLVWTKLLTGVLRSWYVIGLFIVYERFW